MLFQRSLYRVERFSLWFTLVIRAFNIWNSPGVCPGFSPGVVDTLLGLGMSVSCSGMSVRTEGPSVKVGGISVRTMWDRGASGSLCAGVPINNFMGSLRGDLSCHVFMVYYSCRIMNNGFRERRRGSRGPRGVELFQISRARIILSLSYPPLPSLRTSQ